MAFSWASHPSHASSYVTWCKDGVWILDGVEKEEDSGLASSTQFLIQQKAKKKGIQLLFRALHFHK